MISPPHAHRIRSDQIRSDNVLYDKIYICFITCFHDEPEHGRRRDPCKDCGGSGVCEHGQGRTQCKDCRYARAAADAQEKAAAALAAVAALEGETAGRQRQRRSVSSVQL